MKLLDKISRDLALITGAVVIAIITIVFPTDKASENIAYAVITGLFAMAGKGEKQ